MLSDFCLIDSALISHDAMPAVSTVTSLQANTMMHNAYVNRVLPFTIYIHYTYITKGKIKYSKGNIAGKTTYLQTWYSGTRDDNSTLFGVVSVGTLTLQDRLLYIIFRM